MQARHRSPGAGVIALAPVLALGVGRCATTSGAGAAEVAADAGDGAADGAAVGVEAGVGAARGGVTTGPLSGVDGSSGPASRLRNAVGDSDTNAAANCLYADGSGFFDASSRESVSRIV